jgi:hypothetical protein
MNAERCKITFHIANKSKMKHLYQKFENHDEAFIKHLANVRFTKEVMINYRRWLYAIAANSIPCILVPDVYIFHQIERMEQITSDNDIELFFVPAEGIRYFQSPDRKIFTELKAALRWNSIDFAINGMYDKSQFVLDLLCN